MKICSYSSSLPPHALMNGVVLQRIVHSLLWWPIHCLGCPCYLPKLLIFILKSVVAAHVLTIPVKIGCFFWSPARALMARVICLSPSLKSAIPMQLSSSSSLPFVEGKTKPVDSISATLIHQQTAAGGMCLFQLAFRTWPIICFLKTSSAALQSLLL